MKPVFINLLLAVSVNIYAQNTRIDLSRELGSSGLNVGKSNASILNETAANTTVTDSSNMQYSSDGTITESTYRGMPANNTSQPGNFNMDVSPSMMKATHRQGNIGNLKTESATYYDNSGKVQGTSTTIKLGK